MTADMTNAVMQNMLAEKEEKRIENIPFSQVDQIPLLPACKLVPQIKQKKCFDRFITDHIKKNFSYPENAHSRNIQGKVLTQFAIDTKGNVTNITLNGPDNGELLEAEAKRIISMLPGFQPGKHRGKTVNVNCEVPISFKINLKYKNKQSIH